MTMTKTTTFWERILRAILETCDLWDICSEWWEDVTRPTKLTKTNTKKKTKTKTKTEIKRSNYIASSCTVASKTYTFISVFAKYTIPKKHTPTQNQSIASGFNACIFISSLECGCCGEAFSNWLTLKIHIDSVWMQTLSMCADKLCLEWLQLRWHLVWCYKC